MPKYEVEFTISSYGTVTVDAIDEDNAKEIVQEMGLSTIDCDTHEMNPDYIYVKEVESDTKETIPDEQQDDGATGHLFEKKE